MVFQRHSKITEKVVIHCTYLIGSDKAIYWYLKQYLSFFSLWLRAINLFLHSNQLYMCTIMCIRNSETNLPTLHPLSFPIKNEKCGLAQPATLILRPTAGFWTRYKQQLPTHLFYLLFFYPFPFTKANTSRQ